jgi:hypothetical protein
MPRCSGPWKYDFISYESQPARSTIGCFIALLALPFSGMALEVAQAVVIIRAIRRSLLRFPVPDRPRRCLVIAPAWMSTAHAPTLKPVRRQIISSCLASARATLI